MKILIAHAAWIPERQATLARLLEQVPQAEVLASRRREHAAIWARRLWERGEDLGEDICYLNDDVILPPRFVEILEAMALAAPGKCLSLHTSVLDAVEIAKTSSWLRCYWLTGPGYVIARDAHASLIDYASHLPWAWHATPGHNEDRLAIAWAWDHQLPFWSSVPAVVRHDTETASSLGYDSHPLRTSCVDWEIFKDDLTSSEYWRRGVDAPPFVENPWAGTQTLMAARDALAHPHPCGTCWRATAAVRMGGVEVCPPCLGKAVQTLFSFGR